MAKLQKIIMKKKDERMKATTEALNNIKMLKLYSWIDIFLKKILDKRDEELAQLKKRYIALAFNVTSLYFFP